jgi:hypothetical protein
MLKIILVVLLVWLSWAGYQYFTKSAAALILMKQKMDELDSYDFDVLLQESGKGYEYKEVEEQGKKYWVNWEIRKSLSVSAGEGGINNSEIEIRGHVDFIELVPFTNLRTGFPFRLIIKRR